MKKNLKKIIASFLLTIIFLPVISLAQEIEPTVESGSPLLDKLKTVGNSAGYGEATPENSILDIIGTAISVMLSLLGVIFIFLIILAGYNWMTAAGDQEKITKAQHTIRSAIIGLLIIVASFAIWLFISQIIVSDPVIL
jgi:hypothetical protein